MYVRWECHCEGVILKNGEGIVLNYCAGSGEGANCLAHDRFPIKDGMGYTELSGKEAIELCRRVSIATAKAREYDRLKQMMQQFLR